MAKSSRSSKTSKIKSTAIKSTARHSRTTVSGPAEPDASADPIVGASTVTELNGSDKAGSGGPNIGQKPTSRSTRISPEKPIRHASDGGRRG